jgi:hypothetical protein
VTDSITKPRKTNSGTANNTGHHTPAPSESASPSVQETSVAAHDSLDPEAKARRANQIRAYIENNGDATCWEVESALGLLHQSASSTITKLRKDGHLIDSGERRRTNTGRMAIVWAPAS